MSSSELVKMSTLEALKKARETVIVSCSGPTPKEAHRRPQFDMAGVHTMLITGIISVYEQARIVPKSKHYHFVLYALLWWAQVEEHHHFEEEEYYPMFAKQFPLDTIKAEHQLFHDGMDEMRDYLLSTLPKGTPFGLRGKTVQTEKSAEYDGEKLVAIIDSFAVPLTDHLQKEIHYLDQQNLKDEGMTEEEIIKSEIMVQEHIKAESPTLFLVWGCLHSPKSIVFPPIPKILKYFLVPWVFYWPYRPLWQFAPKR